MSKMIQIRNVSDDVHRRLKVRAAEQGLTLSDYLRVEVEALAARPTLAEIRERLDNLPEFRPDVSSAEALRQDRESR